MDCTAADGDRARLHRARPGRLDIPLLAALSGVLLVVGVSMPALEIESLFGDQVYSVLTGIRGFVLSGNILLAVILLVFSVVFPLVKVTCILWLWFRRMPAKERVAVLTWLEWLGKWSLLDTFVIAILLGTVQLGILGSAVVHPGVYIYFAAILGSLVATLLLRRATRSGVASAYEPEPRGVLVTVPSAVLYGLGLSTPLMYVEKWFFWDNEFSLLAGIGMMFEKGSTVLGTALLVLVVVLPSLRYIGLIALRVVTPWRKRLRRLLHLLDLWSMLDVFVLACLVVFTKLGSLATATPRTGLWCLMGAAALSLVDSFLLQRRRS